MSYWNVVMNHSQASLYGKTFLEFATQNSFVCSRGWIILISNSGSVGTMVIMQPRLGWHQALL